MHHYNIHCPTCDRDDQLTEQDTDDHLTAECWCDWCGAWFSVTVTGPGSMDYRTHVIEHGDRGEVIDRILEHAADSGCHSCVWASRLWQALLDEGMDPDSAILDAAVQEIEQCPRRGIPGRIKWNG